MLKPDATPSCPLPANPVGYHSLMATLARDTEIRTNEAQLAVYTAEHALRDVALSKALELPLALEDGTYGAALALNRQIGQWLTLAKRMGTLANATDRQIGGVL